MSEFYKSLLGKQNCLVPIQQNIIDLGPTLTIP